MLELLPQQLTNGLVLGSNYALVALGLTLVFGVLLIPNFAHGELYALGGFLSYSLVAAGVDFWLAAAIVALAVATIGVILDRIVFRPIEQASGLTLMIAALAASIILEQIATLIWGAEPRTIPAPVSAVYRTSLVSVTYYQLLLVGFLVLTVAGLWLVLNRSRLGLAIRAVSQNRAAAALMGIDLKKVRFATFAIGAGLGGLSGALLGANFPIYPSAGASPVLKAFVVLVLGGIGNIWGCVAGSLVLGMVEVLVAGYISSELQDTGAFLILVLVLLLRPQGLFGRAEIER